MDLLTLLNVCPVIEIGVLISIITEDRPVQPEKALSPKEVTLLGIVMEVRLEQL